MRVTTLTVSSQRKMPHPAQDFGNLSALVSLTAELGEGDDVASCTRKLQAQADTLVEKHLDGKAERARAAVSSAKAFNATATMAETLAAKHGGRG